MGLFLQIIGGITIGLIGLILLLILTWKLFNHLLRRYLAAKTADLRCCQTPARLHLRRTPELKWVAPEKVQALGRALTELGFANAGCYSLEEAIDTRLRGFVHEGQAVHAALYENTFTGVWLELASHYEDGEEVIHTNAPEGENLDPPPGQRKVFDRSATPAELFHRHLAERRSIGLRAASISEFQHVLERAYAKTMDWRNTRGGVTEAELHRIATAAGSKLSPKQLQELRELCRNQASEGLDEAVRETFIRTTPLTVSEWEEQKDRLLFVHDLQSPEQNTLWFEAVFNRQEGQEPGHRPDLTGISARAAFARLNESLPPDQRMELIGRVSEPVEADVYLGPEVEEYQVITTKVREWRLPWSRSAD